MSGIGKRFIDAGYKDPKPLILVEGKPIIQHVVERFSPTDNFFFICNEEHIRTTDMKRVLKEIVPRGKIFSIPPHKLGPVYAVLQIQSELPPDEAIIVNYCDFSWRWDYNQFINYVKTSGCDGCVVAYKGFHPHLLHKNLYASMRDDGKMRMLEIREKHSFTENNQDCYQSSGTYYFKSGNILTKYFRDLVDSKQSLNGEYYVSMVYQGLVRDNLRVDIFEIPFMLQWGTPEDLQEYLYWSEIFYESKDVD
jgi:NDP-sugar pyrophosphorylase family protein